MAVNSIREQLENFKLPVSTHEPDPRDSLTENMKKIDDFIKIEGIKHYLNQI
jgi:hypothetical protein